MRNLIAFSLLATSVLVAPAWAQTADDQRQYVPKGVMAVTNPAFNNVPRAPVAAASPGSSQQKTTGRPGGWDIGSMAASKVAGGGTPKFAPPAPPPTQVDIKAPPPIPIPIPDRGAPCSVPGSCSLQINFAYDSAAILPQEESKLKEMANDMLAAPASFMFAIDGYTDSVGPDAYNLNLALKRAASVAAYLESVNPALKDRLRPRGWGKANPMVPRPDQVPEPANRRAAFAPYTPRA